MACNDYLTFKGVSNYSDTQFLTEIENNLKYYFDWAFLSIGAWTDVNIPTSSVSPFTDIYGGSQHILRGVNDDAYTDGQVWQTFKKDLVWESGVDYSDSNYNPKNIATSGVVVNGVVANTGDYFINYPDGLVVFDTAISTSSEVKLEYSYRDVQIYVADNAEWWRELQFTAYRADKLHFTQDEKSGDWSIGSHNRIQLPAIVIEAVPKGSSKGFELGQGSSMLFDQDVIFHVLADDRLLRNKIVSILMVQNDKTIWMFDSDGISNSGIFPLDYRGERINGTLYPDLVAPDPSGYRWAKSFLHNSVMSEVDAITPRLYEGTVRTTCQFLFNSSNQ